MISHAKATSAIAVICGIVLCLGASQAFAAKSVVKSLGASTEGTTGGLFKTPRGIAVNQSGKGAAAGAFYVVDSANNRIQQFSPAGEFLRTWGWGVLDGEAEFQVCKAAASCKAGISGPGAGQMNAPQGIAVDQASGNLYVSDQGNRRIDVFGANGAFQGAFGYGTRTGAAALEFCTTSCVTSAAAGAQGGRFGAAIGGLAVDPITANLYVASKTNRRVDVFKPILSGSAVSNVEFLRAFGWDVETGGVTTFEVCTIPANCKAGSFGANPGQFAAGGASPADVSVDSEGNAYVIDAGNKRIQKFSSTPALITEKFGSTALSEAFGTGELFNVAVDPSSAPNRVLVSARRSAKENRVAVLELDAKGSKLHLHGEELTPSGILTASTGIAVAKASLGGNLYLSTATTGTLQGAYVLSEGPTVEAATGIGAHEATLNGRLVSNDAKVSYRFEYLDGATWVKLPTPDADAGTSSASALIASTGPSTGTLTVKARGGAFTLSFNSETTGSLAHNASAAAVQAALEGLTSIGAGNVVVSGGPGSPDGSTPYAISFQGALAGTEVTQIGAFAGDLLAPTIAVSQVASGLHGNTKYLVRLVATRPSGGLAITSAQSELTTLSSAPTVSGITASAITDTSATLQGEVNPENQPTSYQFEYLTQAAYEANGNSFSGPESPIEVPASPSAVGAGIADLPVAEQLDDLAPQTAYRFRLSATNATGTTLGAERAFTTHSTGQAFESCPNDALRTGPSANLPDCRAYEQASPVDKNGGSIQGTTFSSRTAEDGSTITFESTTGVPGGVGSQAIPTYMAKRGESGWSTTGLLPDPSSGPRARVLGWTPDFATVFDQAEFLNGGGVSMLARSTASGAQTEIAPHTAPHPQYAYIDSSADGQVTIFEAQPVSSSDTTLQLTPNAAPGEPNVYAWNRPTAELRLAGILPDGTTPSEGSRADRGMDSQDYNRDANLVSEDGSVFFNDNTDGQLYLRLNPTAQETTAKDGKGNCIPDPVLACTVHISASQKDNGNSPDGRDPAGSRAADFMAASPDGSVVTFTSAEKLTNDANTGPEPDAPAIARAQASDGGAKNLELVLGSAREVAVDEAGERVYWSDPANGRIGRAKFDGTEVEPDYITGLGEPIGIAVIDEGAAQYVFWTDRGELDGEGKAQEGAGTIGRVDLDGTDANPTCYSGLTNPRSIAVNSEFIYWTAPKNDKGDVGRADLTCQAGGGVSTPQFIDNFIRGDIAINASYIYASGLSGTTGNIWRFDRSDGGFIDTAVSVPDSTVPPGVGLDGTHLFWTDAGQTRIGRADLDGTDASEDPNFIAAAGKAEDLIRGGGHVFWTTNQSVAPNPGMDIYQLDRETGELKDLAPDSDPLDVCPATTTPCGIQALGVLGTSEDGSYVYFAANGVPDNLDNESNDNGEEAELGDCKGDPKKATGTCNLYVVHDGESDFIGRLNAESINTKDQDSGDAVNWVAGHIDVGNDASDRTARVSADGRVLVFRSRSQLTSYDNQGPRCTEGEALGSQVPGPCLEFYRYGYGEQDLACLTCNPRGATPEGPARLASVRSPNARAEQPAITLGRNLSRDGNRFFFESSDSLVAADTNGQEGCRPWGTIAQLERSRACQDVYEWEAPGAGSCTEGSPAYSPLNEGCIYLISTGKSDEASFFADADPDGENVFIYTYEQLVPQDTDALLDAYDARVGGGLAAQHAVDPPACAGEACRSEPIAPPPTQAPGSSGFAGPTDPQPKRAIRKARKKRKQRHQRRKAKRKAAKQRAAKKSRGAGR